MSALVSVLYGDGTMSNMCLCTDSNGSVLVSVLYRECTVDTSHTGNLLIPVVCTYGDVY